MHPRWFCNRCDERGTPYSLSTKSSTWIADHLHDEHQIERGPRDFPISAIQRDGIVGATIIDQMNGKIRTTAKIDKFYDDMMMWISTSRQAFLVIEHPKFRDMISDLSIDAAEMLPKSSNTIRKAIITQFEKQKDVLKERFTQSRSRIHLSMDAWTTPSGDRHFLGIVANWCDDMFEIHNVLIALPEIEGPHTGLNLANIIQKVVDEYNIGAKVGYFMMDNASNNDTAMQELQSLLISRYGEGSVTITSDERRLRCFGHILNLAAKTLLFSADERAFKADINNYPDEKEEEAELNKWRKLGPVGTAHNFVMFIYGSSQRRKEFRKIQVEVLKQSVSILPAKPNATRWNTNFLMINDMLNLREAVLLYISMFLSNPTNDKKDKAKLEKHCMLSTDDWEELINIHALLYDFWELTMRMQGDVAKKLQQTAARSDEPEAIVFNKPGVTIFKQPNVNPNAASVVEDTTEDGALFNVLPAFDYILSKLEAAKQTYAKNTRLSTVVNMAWLKMDEYFQKSDLSKVYFVAAVLDPRVKMKYFEKSWERKWLIGLKEKLYDFMDEFQGAMQSAGEMDDHLSDIIDTDMPDSEESRTAFGSWRESDDNIDMPKVRDEWARYLSLPRVRDYKGFSVRRYWIAERDQFPVLSKLALDTLAIPAMSTEVERVFSGYAL